MKNFAEPGTVGLIMFAKTILFLGILGSLGVCLPSVAAAQPADSDNSAASDEDVETARLHFRNGVDLISGASPNYQDAFRQFQLAYDKSGGNWKVLGNLGLCALKLERDGEALEYYRAYLEKGGDEIDPEERAAIEREMLLIQGNMTTLEITSTEPDVRISVNREGSSAPTQLYEMDGTTTTLGLRAGSLTVTAKGPEKTLTWEAVLSPEETTTHTFDFSAQPESAEGNSAPAAATAASPAERKSKPSGLRIAGYVTAGVGVATLGGGLALGLISQGQRNDAEDQCIDDICPESAEGDFDDAKNTAMIANILFISGGVLTATGVTLAIVGGNKKEASPRDSASLNISPLVTFGGGGIAAFGRF